jgi:DNA modification methylase
VEHENTILLGECVERMKELPDNSIDLIATDPPYGIGFMGKEWDTFAPAYIEKTNTAKSRKGTDAGGRTQGGTSAAMNAARYDHSAQGARRFREWFTEISVEMLRVLKPGAFAFVCIGARQDSVSAAITAMTEAGFKTDFTSIYWTYASGFPKAMNIGKMVDKRNGRVVDPSVKEYLNNRRIARRLSLNQVNELLGTATNGGGVASALMGDKPFNELPTLVIYRHLKAILDLDNRFDELIEREEAEREVIATKSQTVGGNGIYGEFADTVDVTVAATPEAKALDGSYGGFQPKPAVEVIIVAMKPLSEKTFVDQALKNGKGITWLDDAKIPASAHVVHGKQSGNFQPGGKTIKDYHEVDGRFPANLLISDDALNDHSRFFSLDKWAEETLPFLIVAKASKAEKNKRLESIQAKVPERYNEMCGTEEHAPNRQSAHSNSHPTVKPVKLMSYLITLGSRQGDVVLDPFVGSGTTCVAAKLLGRKYIGIERDGDYYRSAVSRVAAHHNLFAP